MADQVTTNYSFIKPQVGGSIDTWGDKLNTNFDSIDAAIYNVEQQIDVKFPEFDALKVTVDGLQNGTEFFSELRINDANYPNIIITDTDAPADSKVVGIGNNNGNLEFVATSDAGVPGDGSLEFVRNQDPTRGFVGIKFNGINGDNTHDAAYISGDRDGFTYFNNLVVAGSRVPSFNPANNSKPKLNVLGSIIVNTGGRPSISLQDANFPGTNTGSGIEFTANLDIAGGKTVTSNICSYRANGQDNEGRGHLGLFSNNGDIYFNTRTLNPNVGLPDDGNSMIITSSGKVYIGYPATGSILDTYFPKELEVDGGITGTEITVRNSLGYFGGQFRSGVAPNGDETFSVIPGKHTGGSFDDLNYNKTLTFYNNEEEWAIGSLSGGYQSDNKVMTQGVSDARYAPISSSIEHKTDLVNETPPESIWDCYPFRFMYNNSAPTSRAGQFSYGLIAEHIESAGFSEAVIKDKDNNITGLDPLALIGALWAEVQSLRDRLSKLEGD